MACKTICYEPIFFKSCINIDSNLKMYLQWVFKLLHTVAEICVNHLLKNFVLGTFCQIIFTLFRHMLPFTNTLTLASSLKSEHFHWVSCSEDSYALDYSKLQHNSISPNLSVGTFCLNTVDRSHTATTAAQFKQFPLLWTARAYTRCDIESESRCASSKDACAKFCLVRCFQTSKRRFCGGL